MTTKYSTLNWSEDGEGWVVTEGKHDEVVVLVNEHIARLGPPTWKNMVENPKADVLTAGWLNGQRMRFVMHKIPGHQRIYCPECRNVLIPPEWGGKTTCHWVPTWVLDEATNCYICTQLTKREVT